MPKRRREADPQTAYLRKEIKKLKKQWAEIKDRVQGPANDSPEVAAAQFLLAEDSTDNDTNSVENLGYISNADPVSVSVSSDETNCSSADDEEQDGVDASASERQEEETPYFHDHYFETTPSPELETANESSPGTNDSEGFEDCTAKIVTQNNTMHSDLSNQTEAETPEQNGSSAEESIISAANLNFFNLTSSSADDSVENLRDMSSDVHMGMSSLQFTFKPTVFSSPFEPSVKSASKNDLTYTSGQSETASISKEILEAADADNVLFKALDVDVSPLTTELKKVCPAPNGKGNQNDIPSKAGTAARAKQTKPKAAKKPRASAAPKSKVEAPAVKKKPAAKQSRKEAAPAADAIEFSIYPTPTANMEDGEQLIPVFTASANIQGIETKDSKQTEVRISARPKPTKPKPSKKKPRASAAPKSKVEPHAASKKSSSMQTRKGAAAAASSATEFSTFPKPTLDAVDQAIQAPTRVQGTEDAANGKSKKVQIAPRPKQPKNPQPAKKPRVSAVAKLKGEVKGFSRKPENAMQRQTRQSVRAASTVKLASYPTSTIITEMTEKLIPVSNAAPNLPGTNQKRTEVPIASRPKQPAEASQVFAVPKPKPNVEVKEASKKLGAMQIRRSPAASALAAYLIPTWDEDLDKDVAPLSTADSNIPGFRIKGINVKPTETRVVVQPKPSVQKTGPKTRVSAVPKSKMEAHTAFKRPAIQTHKNASASAIEAMVSGKGVDANVILRSTVDCNLPEVHAEPVDVQIAARPKQSKPKPTPKKPRVSAAPKVKVEVNKTVSKKPPRRPSRKTPVAASASRFLRTRGVSSDAQNIPAAEPTEVPIVDRPKQPKPKPTPKKPHVSEASQSKGKGKTASKKSATKQTEQQCPGGKKLKTKRAQRVVSVKTMVKALPKILEQRHRRKHNHQCQNCHKKFANRVKLQKHVYNKHRFPGIKCESCKRSDFVDINTLTQHLKTCAVEERLYICKLCSASFKNKNVLNQHLKIHAQLVCSIAQAKIGKNELEEQERIVNKKSSFQCEICSGHCKHKRKLLNPVQKIAPRSQKNHPGAAAEHGRKVDMKTRRFHCQFCSSHYMHKRTLNEHVRVHHPTAS